MSNITDREIEQLNALILHRGLEKSNFYARSDSILSILKYLDLQIEKLKEELLEYKYKGGYDMDPELIERKHIHRQCSLHKIGDCSVVLIKLMRKINEVRKGDACDDTVKIIDKISV